MTEIRPVVAFEDVSLLSESHGKGELRDMSLVLMPGDMALVQVEPGNEHLPLADAAEGLLTPDHGVVRFQGSAWEALKPDDQLAARGRIGRVFLGSGWVSNLTVLENVTLSQRHHTVRPEAEIEEEAQSLARQFGLSEVPQGRPALGLRRDLKRAEWVRAFLGVPVMLILEDPLQGVAVEHEPALMRSLIAARARGAAVLWIADERPEWTDRSLKPPRAFRMAGAQLVPV